MNQILNQIKPKSPWNLNMMFKSQPQTTFKIFSRIINWSCKHILKIFKDDSSLNCKICFFQPLKGMYTVNVCIWMYNAYCKWECLKFREKVFEIMKKKVSETDGSILRRKENVLFISITFCIWIATLFQILEISEIP